MDNAREIKLLCKSGGKGVWVRGKCELLGPGNYTYTLMQLAAIAIALATVKEMVMVMVSENEMR